MIANKITCHFNPASKTLTEEELRNHYIVAQNFRLYVKNVTPPPKNEFVIERTDKNRKKKKS
jgi:hypothetical protein